MTSKLTLSLLLVAAVVVAVVLSGCGGSGGSSGGSAASTATPASTSSAGITIPAAAPVAPTTPLPTFGTRKCWPIVLVHGYAGFRNIGPLEYWFHVPGTLRANGFEVFVVQDTPFATIEERARQVRDQIQRQYPDPRVKINIIAHSQGGLDVRYLVSPNGLGFGDRVASATTIATPHRGDSLADVVYGLLPGPVVDVVNVLFNVVGWDFAAGKELTTWYVNTQFNPTIVDDPRIHYFSWAGHADPTGSGTRSVIEPWFWPTWAVLQNIEGDNDGVVSVASAHWGDFQGVFPSDHFNEVGQPIGLTPKGFDHLAFYESWCEELETRGFGP